MKHSYIKSICILFVIALLSACGGGGGSDDSGNETLTGVFVDSPVKGLRWVSGDLSGTTDAAGTFQYKSGTTVRFYVGDILLGETTGDSVIIPIDIVEGAQNITNSTVTNIVRFLMTLDNDNDPSNGIEITKAVSDLTTGESVNFNLSTTGFTSSGEIQVLLATLTEVTEAGIRSLTPILIAQAHLRSSIEELLAGSYKGTYAGNETGTWTGTVSALGVFSGTATSSDGVAVGFSGRVSSNGSGATNFKTSGGTNDGTSFSGTFEPTGNVSGTWNYLDQQTGTWSGSKN